MANIATARQSFSSKGMYKLMQTKRTTETLKPSTCASFSFKTSTDSMLRRDCASSSLNAEVMLTGSKLAARKCEDELALKEPTDLGLAGF